MRLIIVCRFTLCLLSVMFVPVLLLLATSVQAEELLVRLRLEQSALIRTASAVGRWACDDPQQVLVRDRLGRYWKPQFRHGAVVFVPTRACPPAKAPGPDALPDGVVTPGGGGRHGIHEAWLTEPTRRYDHGILGDAIEAGGLRVRIQGPTPEGLLLDYTLPTDSVFEDRFPRLVQLAGEPEPLLLVIRTWLERGAGLALFAVARGRLEPMAQSEPIGQPHRWLNPVGVGDFDNDGNTEIAAVVKPHIGGTLTLFRREGPRLRKVYEQRGFSNHGIGMRNLGMSAVLDANGDDVPDLAVPDARRIDLRIVTFADGRFAELQRIAHHTGIGTAIEAANLVGDSRLELIYALDNGELRILGYK